MEPPPGLGADGLHKPSSSTRNGKKLGMETPQSFLWGRETKRREEEAEKQQQLQQNKVFKRKTAQKSPPHPQERAPKSLGTSPTSQHRGGRHRS